MSVESIKAFIANLQAQLIVLLNLQKKQLETTVASLMSNESLYQNAKKNLGVHLTLDSTVPGELGCAEAVSKLLVLTGFNDLPSHGIAGTAALFGYLKGSHFKQTSAPRRGSIIISPTGTSTIGSPHGHVGIVGDQGVMSNDSDTGLWAEKYTLTTWEKYFHTVNGFPVYFFDIA